MSSATQLELTVAEGLLDALDTQLGIATARRLLGDDSLEEAEARERLEEMLRPKCAGCGEAVERGKACADCGLVEADSVADLLSQDATDIGQDANFPKRVGRKKRRRAGRKHKKVQEATVIGGTAATPSSGTATPWGGVVPAVASGDTASLGGREADMDFIGRSGGSAAVDAVWTRGEALTTPPNLRDSTGLAACGNCVFFGNGLCNLYGWDRDGTPEGADMVHRGGTPVDEGDVCDAHTTLTPRVQRLAESLDREDARLAEAARAENPSMTVRARARVRRAEEMLDEALAEELNESLSSLLHRKPKESALHYAMRRTRDGGHGPAAFGGNHHGWSDEARAAALAARRAKGGVTEKGRLKGQMGFSTSLKPRPNRFAKGGDLRSLAGVPQAKRALQHAMEEAWEEALSEVKSDVYPGLDRSPKKNWVDKAGGLPRYIERIAKHLHYEKGKEIGTAIAIAVNVVKKMCASGDTNFPGKQNVNPKSRAQACAAVAEWERKKGATSARGHAANAARTPLQHGAVWDSFGVALELTEASFRPIPPSDRFIESVLREINLVEGSSSWYEGMALLDEAEALIERYAEHLDEVAVVIEENVVSLLTRGGKKIGDFAGHWDPMKHPRTAKGRTGGGEFRGRTEGVLSGMERHARGSVGSRDKQRGYRHPESAPMHERMVAEMFDRPGRDHSIFPAERKALASYLNRRGASDLAQKIESSNARMISSEDAMAISRAVRGEGVQMTHGGPKMRQLAGRASMPRVLRGDPQDIDAERGLRPRALTGDPNDIDSLGTVAHRASSVEDAFKGDNRRHLRGRSNSPDFSVDQAISETLAKFPGLKDWHVEKAGDSEYHVHVEMPDKKHVISVTSGGKVKDITPGQTQAPKSPVPAKFAGVNAHGEPSTTNLSHAVASLDMLEPAGHQEKPYHMEDGDFFMGHDGVLYQKLESGPKLMMGKKGPLAGVRIHNHKTGTQKVAPAFALSTYYDVMRPKGSGGSKPDKIAPAKAAHADIESQLAKSIAGQSYQGASSGGGASVAGKHVVISGAIPGHTRKEAEAKLASQGAIIHSSVSSHVDWLITGEKGAGGAKKLENAAKFGVSVKAYPEMKHLFEAEFSPETEGRLAQLERVEMALTEATAGQDVVRLRARRRALREQLGLEERALTSKARDSLSKSDFVFPETRRYPIHDESHARNALSRASGKPEEARVRAAVKKRYPGLGG